MKIIRFIIINLVILFLVVTIIFILIPSHVRISRAINLAASADSVLLEIDDLNKWKYWFPGYDTITIEPLERKDSKVIRAKIPGTVLSVKDRTKNEVVAEFKAEKGKPVIARWQVINYNHTDSLTLQWYLDFQLRWYPWEKFASLMYEKTYGTKMEAGLNNLKKIAQR